ncbi:MAG: spermidine/putrescine ABC transporter substrate-binding protein [Rhizobiales bacterium]|nr:spermidine/putrescine ABC transporter substrate-binding protein [Hyphomicrobiales bacterium]
MSTYRPKFRPSRRALLQGTGAFAVGLTFLPRFSLAEEEKKLNFYNWDTYIGERTLEDFQKATGIETKLDLYADNAELFAKLKSGNPGYDVIVPSDSWIERLVGANMLMPLDQAKIPNTANIDPRFADAVFDKGRKYTIPYMWGTLGIGYNKKVTNGVPDSWKVCYDSDQYKGRVSLLGDARTVIGLALKYLGKSLNSTDPKDLKQAEDLIIANKKNLKVFAPDNGQDLLASGEVDIAQEWNGDILQVMGENADLDYVVPTEGTQVWQDTMAIAAGAPHPDNAHKFLNFILDAQAGADIAKFINYATANLAARKLLDDSYNKNTSIFPPEEILVKSEAQIYLGEDGQKLFEDSWTRIQAA